MREKRVFTKDLKEWTVGLARTTDQEQSEIAVKLRINGNLLTRWK
jgi:transposase-like protein